MAAVPSLRAAAERGLAWTSVSTVIVRLSTVGITVYVARVLTPDAYGVLAAAMVVVGALWILNDFGFGPAVIQQRGDLGDAASTALAVVGSLGAVAAVALYVGSEDISGLLGQPRAAPLLAVLSLAVWLRALAVVPVALLDQALEFRKRAVIDVVAAICLVGTAVVLLGSLRWGARGVAWAYVAQSLATSIGAWILAPRHRFHRPSWHMAQRLGRVARNVFVGGVIAYLATNLDNVFLSRSTTARILGGYVFAYAAASLPAVQLADVAGRVLFPIFVSLQEQPQRLSMAYKTSLAILLRASLPLLLLISLLGPLLVHRFLGSGWTAASDAIQILPVFGAIRVIAGIGGPLLLASGRSAAIVRTGLFGLCAQAALLWLLVVEYDLGAIGASIAVSAASAATLFVIARALAPVVHMSAPRQLLWIGQLGLPTIASAAVWVVISRFGTTALAASIAIALHIGLTVSTGGRREIAEMMRTIRTRVGSD